MSRIGRKDGLAQGCKGSELNGRCWTAAANAFASSHHTNTEYCALGHVELRRDACYYVLRTLCNNIRRLLNIRNLVAISMPGLWRRPPERDTSPKKAKQSNYPRRNAADGSQQCNKEVFMWHPCLLKIQARSSELPQRQPVQ